MNTYIVRLESETDTDNHIGPFSSYDDALVWAERRDVRGITSEIHKLQDPWELDFGRTAVAKPTGAMIDAALAEMVRLADADDLEFERLGDESPERFVARKALEAAFGTLDSQPTET